jgi:hypothetical protein
MSTRDAYKLGKTYRSTNEAFRDADYATPIWRCETEWDRTKTYLYPLLSLVVAGFFLWALYTGFISWLVS